MPVIRSVEVTGFQSLRRVKVGLGRFTVITGPTGSGKSALVRAIQLLAFNARGTSYITRGETGCSVMMTGDEIELDGVGDEPWTAVVHRTSNSHGDFYKLFWSQMGQREHSVFTKLGGKVPAQVSAMLRITDLNYAEQFDRPFLLDASGGEVARVLGKLTNVTQLFRAAGEGERLRRAAVAELRTRKGDLDRLVAEARQYEDLPRQKAAVERAEAAMARAADLEFRLSVLERIKSEYRRAQYVLERIHVPDEPPAMGNLDALALRYARLRLHARVIQDAREQVPVSERRLAEAQAAEAGAQRELDEYMALWGVCPVCGQRVKVDA
jgi:DNA repair protein SbcC/Rad50